MAKDFRPKAARQAAAGSAKKVGNQGARKSSAPPAPAERQKVKPAEEGASPDGDGDEDEDASSEEEEDESALLREIKALGGNEEDLKLISKTKGKGKGKELRDEDEEVDPALGRELMAFMQGLDYKSAGVSAPSFETSQLTAKQSKKAVEKANKKEKGNGLKDGESVKAEAGHSNGIREGIQNDRARPGFVVIPTPQWSDLEKPDLPTMSSTPKQPSNELIEQLHGKADRMLAEERATYIQMTNSGKAGGGGPGMLSSSDAKFIAELLGPGSRGGTLSDRIAALTLLAQTSPVHNVDSMEMLLGMASKKGREESGKATRALADWLVSGGGLPDRKLRYFRDQPLLPHLVALQNDSTLRGQARLAVDMHLVLAAFEDKLKRFYFEFIKLLETQSHDTVPFVRKQAVTQTFILLKEKPEQEQNLLRLLVNKLGDSDRGVASKASSLILSLLNTHPAMKAVVTDEVSNLVMHAPSALSQAKGTPNAHAQYYGVLTLNQTMLTNADESVANKLVSLYFVLFEGLLQELARQSNGKEETGEEQDGKEVKDTKRDKGRWRDGKRGKKGQGAKQNDHDPSTLVKDADAKIMAAILAGVRRALPFAKMDGALIEKHMDTLFRITHCSTFNISIQALQLIQQVCLAGHVKGPSAALSSSKLQDRFYRALYASMLDPRLAQTSKQAMYLNLLFKSMKADMDDGRTKAFVKRLAQLLTDSEPPFVCGSLFLLGELLIAKPGLRSMLNEAEDDGEEHFVDVPEEEEEDADEKPTTVSAKNGKGYDGLKREPRFARAESTCLWEIVPLLSHFHPSVSLCAAQLLTGQRISSTADLNMHTLAHFLDRFVYRNPKKRVAMSKGVSLMQPALHANSVEAGVMRLRGVGIRKDEFVNDDAFWRKKASEVPADQLFFHKFFNLRRAPATGDAQRGSDAEQDDSDSSDRAGSPAIEGEQDDQEEDGAGASSDEDADSEMEREIWKEMRRTMPRQEGDEILDESEGSDDDDLDPDLMASSNGDSEKGFEGLSEDDDGDNAFDEDEDDLLPFEFGSEDEESADEGAGNTIVGRKRKAGGDDEAGEAAPAKSKSQARREERKKRKAMPTFATAEDYAHLLGGSDDEGNDD